MSSINTLMSHIVINRPYFFIFNSFPTKEDMSINSVRFLFKNMIELLIIGDSYIPNQKENLWT